MVIQEHGKLYNIDDETGLVTEASIATEEVEALDEEYRLGDRVEVVGSVGEIVSIVPSYYGLAFGVRFDDGEFDEYVETQLKRSAVEKPAYDTPQAEVMGRFAAYQELPTFTNDELDKKEAEAKWLKLRASSLVTDKTLDLGEQNSIATVLLTAESDLRDIKELRTTSEESQQYLAQFNQYKLADDVGGYGAGMGGKDDSSWLGVEEVMEVVETVDADLAARATEVVASLTREQLQDDEFMSVAGGYQHTYLQMTKEQAKTFDAYLSAARAEVLKDEPEVKTASVKYNLDDASDIFI